ncbi:MAG: ABC transporter permease, partial [Trueperaceae bacterium]
SGHGPAFRAVVALVDVDGAEGAARFASDVLASDALREVFTVHRFEDRDAARDALAAREVDAAFVLHDGLERIEVLRDARAPLAGTVAASVADAFAAQIDAVARTVATTVAVRLLGPDAFDADGWNVATIDASEIDPAGVSDVDLDALAQAVADAPLGTELHDASAGAHDLSPAAYFGPGMAMLFVFFTLAAAPRSLLAERRDGTLARLRAAPIPPMAIVAGTSAAAAILGLASLLAVWGATALLFGARWGDPLAVLVVLLAFLTAAAAIATLACAYARSDAQADGIVSVVAFVLAMIGGNFLLLSDMPPALRTVALATPNGQALQAFLTLTADGGTVRDVLGSVAMIVAFAAAALAASVPGLRRWVAS